MKTQLFSEEAIIRELTMMVLIEFEDRLRTNQVHVQRDALDSFMETELLPIIQMSVLKYMAKNNESPLVIACRCQCKDLRGNIVHLLMRDVCHKIKTK